MKYLILLFAFFMSAAQAGKVDIPKACATVSEVMGLTYQLKEMVDKGEDDHEVTPPDKAGVPMYDAMITILYGRIMDGTYKSEFETRKRSLEVCMEVLPRVKF